MVSVESLHPVTYVLLACPKTGVMYRADYAAPLAQPWKEGKKNEHAEVGSLGVGMYDIGPVAQESKYEMKGKEQCRNALEEEMETHIGNDSAMGRYTCLVKLIDKRGGEAGMRAQHLNNMILELWRLRAGYVDSHALRAAHVEMGYYVENFFLHTYILRNKR